MALKNIFNRLKFWKRTPTIVQSDEERLANSLRKYECCVFKTQSILMWDNPSVSILSVIFINILFWLLSKLEWRVYGIVCTCLLALTVHEAWVQHIWPEISVPVKNKEDNVEPSTVHPSVMAVSKVITSILNSSKDHLTKLVNLRSQQPAVFSSILGIVFTALMIIGRTVSVFNLLYVTIMAIMIIPGVFKHSVSLETRNKICDRLVQAQSTINGLVAGDESDDEYLPETSKEDLLILTKVSDLNNEMQKSDESSVKGSSSVSGLSFVPSLHEASLDSLAALSDLEPTGDFCDDSDSASDDAHHIQFQSGHFNGDSSSEDEEKAFTKDLTFSEVDSAKPEEKSFASIFTETVSNKLMETVGKELLANVIGSPPSAAPRSSRLDSDSDVDDFEIINQDELDES